MRKLHYKLRFNVVSYIEESKEEALGPHHSPEKLVKFQSNLGERDSRFYKIRTIQFSKRR